MLFINNPSSRRNGGLVSARQKTILSLDAQLCFALYTASRAMTTAYRPMLDALGITYPQYLVLLVLWESDKLNITDIGARLHLDSGTLTPMIKRMERGGLVRRVRDRDDERCVRVMLAAGGRALKSRAATIPRKLACKVGITHEEAMKLRQQVARITEALCAEPDAA